MICPPALTLIVSHIEIVFSNASPIQNDHLAEMELEGNKVEEVAEVR